MKRCAVVLFGLLTGIPVFGNSAPESKDNSKDKQELISKIILEIQANNRGDEILICTKGKCGNRGCK